MSEVKSLDSYPSIKKDKNAKSLSYFFTTNKSFINTEILDIMQDSVVKEKTNIRVSLHSSPDNLFHNMIIAQGDFTYNKPHKHVNKAETYHILYGEQLVVIFNDDGTISDKFLMSKEENMIYRFEKGIFHMTIPLTPCCIFHESKIGPFVREGDSIFASWAPNENESQQFISNLLKGIK